MHIGKIVIS